MYWSFAKTMVNNSTNSLHQHLSPLTILPTNNAVTAAPKLPSPPYLHYHHLSLLTTALQWASPTVQPISDNQLITIVAHTHSAPFTWRVLA